MDDRSSNVLLQHLKIWVIGLLLLATTFAELAAQDLDDLFSEPDSTTDVPDGSESEFEPDGGSEETSNQQENTGEEDGADELTEASPAVVDIGALTTSPTRVTGRVTARAGFGIGFIEWPGSEAAKGRSVRDLMEYSIPYDTTASMAVDSRPQPYLRFYSKLTTSLSESSLTFGTPEVDSLFVDYTVADSVFLRAGTFDIGWGRARLFDNPANLVSRVDEGAAIRASIPSKQRERHGDPLYASGVDPTVRR